jgi:CHAT domain-containing protein/tetratricopeptide (TPR) repeat protein
LAALIGVCLVLALWMTGSRPAARHRIGSIDSGSRWDQAYFQFTDSALRYRQTGELRLAEQVYEQGVEEATRRGDKLAIVRFQMSVGGCRLLLIEYRTALTAFLDARTRAIALHDTIDTGAIAVNLSSIYLQMWDTPSAQKSAEEGLAASSLFPDAYFVPALLLQLGRIHALQKDGATAEAFYWRGMEAARRSGDGPMEARGWDWLGDEYFARDAIPRAESLYLEAYRLRLLSKSGELGFSYGRLGALRLTQGRLEEAGRLTQLAEQAVRSGKPGWPEHVLRQQEGNIELARGAVDAALQDFSQAIEASTEWRLNILSSRSSLTAANTGLEEKIYRSFVELAADHSVRSHNSIWTVRAFQALELNRAASLRQSLALADVWREKLPAEYWETVDQLEAAQAKALRTGRMEDVVASLHLKITEMEAGAGLTFAVKKDENFRTQSSLNHFQAGLEESELFLTFLLGRDGSYVWAVSRESMHLYRLGRERVIEEDVAAFRKAIVLSGLGAVSRSGLTGEARTETEAERKGQELYEDLFGPLNFGERSKKNWLVSLEGALFEVPFAALVERRNGHTVYLVQKHSIQAVPGALLLARQSDQAGRSGWFLGVGDPIYNAADSRWSAFSSTARPRATATSQLVRLVASGEEVRSSAASWRRQSGTATILEGFQADRNVFLEQLARGPRVIHLATHVVVPQTDLPGFSREQSFVAFSIPAPSSTSTVPARSQSPQYLTTARIATLHVPGALVVMTGCSTGTGDARAGAGLIGLTRAWLMAGASGVLSTVWPVEDSSGEIFSKFYRYYPEVSAAEALRRSQVDMLYHARPAQWASYQLTGGLR